ncbi:MAG TPA: hypothetical protein VG992_04410 [Candidatus Saccharimonadales bacterium]|nr:hypothetical protein [Candidatus Saccharimonadales bacterium]
MLRKLALSLATLSVMLFAAPAMAHAATTASLFSGACGAGNTAGSAACGPDGKGNTNPLSGNDGVIIKITRIIAIIAGSAAIIVLIVAALKYITAGGDSNAISAARGTMINALVGIVIIVLAQSIIVYVVKKISN